MKSQIINQLEKIEKENNVSILYACESGSRAWGFDNDSSDYDVRFIFKRNDLRDYLSLSEKRDVIEYMDDNLDIVGWDIKKALRLHHTNNPNLREWIKSPIRYIDWKINLFDDLPDFDDAVLKYHYTNIASSNWKRLNSDNLEINPKIIKMYMYNCRCILTWMVLDEDNDPSINIFDLLGQLDGLDGDIKEDILNFIHYYKNSCKGNFDSQIIERINRWMDNNLKIMRGDFPQKRDVKDLREYDERFFEILIPDGII